MTYDMRASEAVRRRRDAKFIRACADAVEEYEPNYASNNFDSHAQKSLMRSCMKQLIGIAMAYIDV